MKTSFLIITALLQLALGVFGQAEIPTHEWEPGYWQDIGETGIEEAVKRFQNLNTNKAKNVIIFLGDGMSLSTVVAGRILKGQRANSDAPGEEAVSSLDKLPHAGLLKTYSVDFQTPDSAATATAFLCGVKTRSTMLGVSAKSFPGNCRRSRGNEVPSILEYSAMAGKSTGVVTTTRVQHATPAAAYAKTPSRSWYSDGTMKYWPKKQGCRDIATQLVDRTDQLNVVLGGGRVHMRPKTAKDEEYYSISGTTGDRQDGRDLIEDWLQNKPRGQTASYVWNKSQFDDIDPTTTDYLMGLFNPYEMQFALDRPEDPAGEPSLSAMTEKAIRILRKNDKGFFLLVESGMIDKAHHKSLAHYALEEFLELEKSVEVARDLTDESETMIIVTADHGHVFTIGGGTAKRGNPIFGLAPSNKRPRKALDGNYYTTLGYANGAGGFSPDKRPQVTLETAGHKDHIFQAAVPLPAESHSAEDVIALSSGPMSHMVHGVHEQNYLAHVVMYASCVGPSAAKWEHCISSNPSKLKSAARSNDEVMNPVPWEEEVY